MENPCIKCKMSQSEKAACCGCADRLEYEKLQRTSNKQRSGKEKNGNVDFCALKPLGDFT